MCVASFCFVAVLPIDWAAAALLVGSWSSLIDECAGNLAGEFARDLEDNTTNRMMGGESSAAKTNGDNNKSVSDSLAHTTFV